MKICMDIQPAVAQRAGVGRYVRELAAHLGAGAGEDRLRLFCFDFRGAARLPEASGATVRAVRWFPGRLAQAAWRTIGWPPFDLFAGEADLYHFTNFIAPPLARGRCVVTIHDMSFARFPEFAEERNLHHLKGGIAATAARADAIITISRSTADEVHELLGVERSRLFPIHLGVSTDFSPQPAEAVARIRKRYGLDGPYLLSVGTVEPRKNIPLLLDVFEQLVDFNGKLVLVGGLGWKCEPILARIRQSPKADRICRIGFVQDGDLPALYTGAELFLLSSFYEGFGFPPLEAMACGTPVLSAIGGSLAEVLGEGARLLRGHEPDAWLDAASELLSDSAMREDLVRRGRNWVRQYTWQRTAEQTWQVYRSLA